jgi:hypothetical protein
MKDKKARSECLVNGYLQNKTAQKQEKICQNKNKVILWIVVHACNPCDWEAKTGRS